jgi:hypothetical protein
MLNRDDDAKYVGSYDVQGTEELATNLQLEECCVETSTKRQYLFPLLITITVLAGVEELQHKLPKNGPPCIVPFVAILKRIEKKVQSSLMCSGLDIAGVLQYVVFLFSLGRRRLRRREMG